MGLSRDPAYLTDLVEMIKTGRAYKTRKLDDLLSSYAVTAVGRILETNPDKVDKAIIDVLKKAMINLGTNTKRSAVLAYGEIDVSEIDKSLVASMVKTLEHVVKKGENQAANFALISLGKIGGRIDDRKLRSRIFETLRTGMKKGNYTQKPFGALALGLMGRSPRSRRTAVSSRTPSARSSSPSRATRRTVAATPSLSACSAIARPFPR
jgi:hypothetical protein